MSHAEKRKRPANDDALSGPSDRAQKRHRGELSVLPFEANETQTSMHGDPRSGQEDSDAQEESFTELARLRSQVNMMTQQREMYKNIMKEYVYRIFTLEHKVNRLEIAMQGSGNQGPIADLPNEMIYEVFGFLPLADLLSCEMVCRNWRESLLEWLRVLDLSPFNNAVNDQVVVNVSKYRNMESLSLARCKDVKEASVDVIVRSFPNLKELDIFGCQVVSFDKFSDLHNLISLRIGDCIEVKDHHLKLIPQQLKKLSIEWLLDVQNEGLQNLAHMTNLVSLRLEQNDNMKPTSMVLPDTLIPTLKKFVVIRQGFFTDASLEPLHRFENLETLTLYWVPIAGQGFNVFAGKMKSLRKLKLLRCHTMSNAGMDSMTRALKHLKALHIKGISQVDREGYKYLSRMNALKDLRLRCGREIIDENQISDLEFLANMRLHRLELIDARGITGVGIKKIVDTQEFTLEHFLIRDCGLMHSYDLTPLKRCKRLRYFLVDHATHLRAEGFKFKMLLEGGIDFTSVEPPEPGLIDLAANEGSDDARIDDDDEMVVQPPHGNAAPNINPNPNPNQALLNPLLPARGRARVGYGNPRHRPVVYLQPPAQALPPFPFDPFHGVPQNGMAAGRFMLNGLGMPIHAPLNPIPPLLMQFNPQPNFMVNNNGNPNPNPNPNPGNRPQFRPVIPPRRRAVVIDLDEEGEVQVRAPPARDDADANAALNGGDGDDGDDPIKIDDDDKDNDIDDPDWL